MRLTKPEAAGRQRQQVADCWIRPAAATRHRELDGILWHPGPQGGGLLATYSCITVHESTVHGAVFPAVMVALRSLD